MTYDELSQQVKQRLTNQSDKAVLDATCWFIAVHEARGVLDAWSLKDFARAIVAGEPLAGPFQTIENVEAWIKELTEDAEEAMSWAWLDEALDRHFGIDRRAR